MYIKEVNIENFKCFKGKFNLKLKQGLNILVGDNETGKSTILEAIHLALTGLINGHYIKNELSQNLFNNEVVAEYIKTAGTGAIPPYILIEVFIAGDELPSFEGDGNSEKKKECCVSMKIAFNDKYKGEYAEFIKGGNVKNIPTEYYEVEWNDCARGPITKSTSVPIKSALIDSSSYRYQNGSDIYISYILRNHLENEDMVGISQTLRKMQEFFLSETPIVNINTKIKNATNISKKELKLSVDLTPKNAWESSLMAYLDDVPFQQIGKGEQCIIKTKLALSNGKSQYANLILLEEPENHLSHTKLNQFINDIKDDCEGKQIVVTTHSSFVANKLGLESLTLLKERKTIPLTELSPDTYKFFEKIPGYDTLRLVLCKKAILVEGDSDELAVQKAYLVSYKKLPIEDGLDVISVGTSFLRFLEIAEKIDQQVIVVTDNDGDVNSLNKKYENYLGSKTKSKIKICFSATVDTGPMINGSTFNYNTLEPKLLKVNSLEILNKVFGKQFKTDSELLTYMKGNKTECALAIFDTKESIKFPQYILNAIS
ncbi:MAG: AAA family ATPase [Candidatus Woesebacteria bacterium]|nr:MAG: AAA family ATPase [Candidatus Woesebacteria bacterium]